MRKIRKGIRLIESDICLVFRKLIGYKINASLISLISPLATLKTIGKGKIFLGEKVEICRNVELTAKDATIMVGKNCFINRNCMIVAHKGITIEDDVTIGPGTTVYDHDHRKGGGYVTAPVRICSGVWLGANVSVLKGVTIGKNTIVSAGSVVTKDIPADSTFIQKRNTIIIQNKE